MARRPQPSLRMADGGSFITRWAQNVMRPAQTRTAQAEAAALGKAPTQAPAPVPAPPPPPNPNATPDNPAGIRFKDGGSLRTGMGGHVPGSGSGDKIPAKYEPGEFVVSNDMLDDNPGLREQLASLRAETLNARGKTVAEADAKALRYHGGFGGDDHGQEAGNEDSASARTRGRDVQREDWVGAGDSGSDQHSPQAVRNVQVSLRAQSGFNGSADPDFWRGNPDPMRGSQANETLLKAARDRIDPAQTAARGAYEKATAPTTKPLSVADAAAYDASAEGRATQRAAAQVRAQQAGIGSKYTPPPAAAPAVPPVAAPAAPSAAPKYLGAADQWRDMFKGAPDSPNKTLRLTTPEAPRGIGKGLLAVQGAMGAKDLYDGIQEGDTTKAAIGGADALAAGALFTPAAPLAGAYLGVRGAWDAGKAAGGAIYDNLTEKARDTIGGTVNQIGLNTGLWGEDGSAKLMADARERLASPAGTPRTTTPSAAPDPRNPYADANAAKIAAADAQNKAAPPAAAPAAPPGYTNNVTRNGNSYEGTNVRGDITINGVAPGAGLSLGSGPNAQNMAAGDALAGRDTLRSQGAALGGQPAGGSGIPAMAPTLHSGNSWEARNNLRNLEVSASSIYNSRSHWGNKAKGAADVAAFQNAQAMDTAARTGSDPGSVSRTNAQASMFGSKVAADASRYGSDNSLRGTMYTADAQLGAKQLEMQQRLRQQQLMGSIYEAAGGDPVKAAKLAAQYGMDPKAFTDMASAQQTYGFNAAKNAQGRLESLAVKDGKVDPAVLAQVRATTNSIAPGFEQMDEAGQAGRMQDVLAANRIVQGANATRNNTWLRATGISKSAPESTTLPDFDGADVDEVGLLEGLLTPNVGRGDYKVTKNGREVYLPRDSINTNELELMKRQGARLRD